MRVLLLVRLRLAFDFSLLTSNMICQCRCCSYCIASTSPPALRTHLCHSSERGARRQLNTCISLGISRCGIVLLHFSSWSLCIKCLLCSLTIKFILLTADASQITIYLNVQSFGARLFLPSALIRTLIVYSRIMISHKYCTEVVLKFMAWTL